MTDRVRTGNLLGAARAEIDGMLSHAFIATADFRSLTQTQDFHYVVGRRGTGKTALFQKVTDFYKTAERTSVIAETPQEHNALQFQNLLGSAGIDYRLLRSISRLTWKTHLLLEAFTLVRSHYKYGKSASFAYLTGYERAHRPLIVERGIPRALALLRHAIALSKAPREVAFTFAQTFETDSLQQAMKTALEDVGLRVVVLYDALDEGWTPDIPSTAVIGGLAIAAADLSDLQIRIHPLMFLRDNIFRSLAQMDPDSTRHIEGQTLRLHWDEASLFHLVAERIKIALELKEENDVRAWNRFAQADLKDREGFEACLRHTLYRPRDILVLLNDASAFAQREGRESIVGTDVDKTAVQISENRLDDLLKEYETVLPGLKDFVASFRQLKAQWTIAELVAHLDQIVQRTEETSGMTGEFALFNSGAEILNALYSVGFVGVQEQTTGRFAFCHDGSASTLTLSEPGRRAAVHPCYWKALELVGDAPTEEVAVQINDDYEAKTFSEVSDLRLKRLGQIHAEVSRIQRGKNASGDFERWVNRAVAILFEGKLTNIQLKPNPEAVNQRDIVATNMAVRGFWKRIYEDYRSRQVVFEVKNYGDLELDDLRQVLSYTSGEYGSFAVLVWRPESEIVPETLKAWLRMLYSEHRRVVLRLPDTTIARCLLKLRSPRKFDAAEDTLGKLMDQVVRTYLSIQVGRGYRRGKKRRRR